MDSKPFKILAINSLPAYGMAGLKCIIPVLDQHIVPIPSLILTGLGNLPGHQKFYYDFEENLNGALLHLKEHQHQVVLYVGYLGGAEQVDIIKASVEANPTLIKSIVIDPVCGDNGKPYVSPAVIEAWPKLLELANWATPNATEVMLLSKQTDVSYEAAIVELRLSYPATKWIITSLPKEGAFCNRLILGQDVTDFNYEYLPYAHSGTGDTFTSYFIKYHFLEGQDPATSLIHANSSVRARLLNHQIALK